MFTLENSCQGSRSKKIKILITTFDYKHSNLLKNLCNLATYKSFDTLLINFDSQTHTCKCTYTHMLIDTRKVIETFR